MLSHRIIVFAIVRHALGRISELAAPQFLKLAQILEYSTALGLVRLTIPGACTPEAGC